MPKILFTYLLLLFYTTAFSQGSRNLIAHWKFSGNANDSSGNGLNGITTGTTATAGYNGIANTALYFNGTSDHMDVPYNSLMNLDSFSICALLKPLNYYSSLCQGNFILMRAHEGDSSAYCLQFNDEVYDHNNCYTFEPDHEQFVCEAHANAPGWPAGLASEPEIDTDKWYCVVATYAGDSIRIYVDGVKIGATVWPDGYATSTDPIGIGYYPIGSLSGYPYWFNGIIDDIRLYGRALTAAEAGLYCDTAKMPPSVTPPVTVNDTLYINSNKVGCDSFSFVGISNDTLITSYNWGFGDGSTGNGNPVHHVYGKPGSYTITLVTTDANNKKDTANYILNVIANKNIVATGDTTLCRGETDQLYASGAISYSWSPPIGLNDTNIADPLATPDFSTLYTVTGTDTNGCMSRDSVNVNVTDCLASIGVPGAFSPNGDGSNDILYVRGRNIKSIHFEIFNRWGIKVFATDNINQGWDGTYNGTPQPVETYAYTLKAITVTGEVIKKKGSITLLR